MPFHYYRKYLVITTIQYLSNIESKLNIFFVLELLKNIFH